MSWMMKAISMGVLSLALAGCVSTHLPKRGIDPQTVPPQKVLRVAY